MVWILAIVWFTVKASLLEDALLHNKEKSKNCFFWWGKTTEVPKLGLLFYICWFTTDPLYCQLIKIFSDHATYKNGRVVLSSPRRIYVTEFLHRIQKMSFLSMKVYFYMWPLFTLSLYLVDVYFYETNIILVTNLSF